MATPYQVRLAISRSRSELYTEDLGDTDGDPLPESWENIEEWIPYLLEGASSLPSDSGRKLGKGVFELLLGGPENGKKWAEVIEQSKRQDRSVRLLIDATDDAVRDLPFGLLCEPHDNYYLLRPRKGCPAVRPLRVIRRCTPRRLHLSKKKGPIKVLLAAAEPRSSDVRGFDGPRWLCELARGLAALPEAYAVSLVTLGGARPLADAVPGPADSWKPEHFEGYCRTTRDGLQAALADGKCELLHLLAHGTGDGLLLCDSAGRPAEVAAGELGEWCGKDGLEMAFLQVCKSARVEGRGGFGGIAQQLLNPSCGNLAAVVASSFPLDAELSNPAALAFYKGLAQGKGPDEAIERGLKETNWTWALLELWVRPGALPGMGTREAAQSPSPYRGLAPFQESDAELFFGRSDEIPKMLRALQQDPLLTVVGDSGSGKTSLIQAGLVPALRRDGLGDRKDWRVVVLRPGPEPARSLLAALAAADAGPGAPAVAARAPKDWAAALQERLADSPDTARPTVVILDQFEQVFTLCQDEAQRRALAAVLGELVRRRPEHLRLVLGLRGDYLGAAAALPGLGRFFRRPWVLRPPGPDEFRSLVLEPATAFGYTFQGPLDDGDPRHHTGLLERILDDPLLKQGADEAPGLARVSSLTACPLPLLGFVLERLWLRAVARGSSEFTHEDYDRLGELSGALSKHAERVFASIGSDPNLGAPAQRLAEQFLTGVVGPRGTRRPRPRAELVDGHRDPRLARRVLDILVAERLLRVHTDRTNGSRSLIEIAHPVLIDRWERLALWLSEDPGCRSIMEEFASDAERWDLGTARTPRRSRGNLPASYTAVGYLYRLDKCRPALSGPQRDFADELRAMLRRRDRRRVLLTVAMLVALPLGGALAPWGRIPIGAPTTRDSRSPTDAGTKQLIVREFRDTIRERIENRLKEVIQVPSPRPEGGDVPGPETRTSLVMNQLLTEVDNAVNQFFETGIVIEQGDTSNTFLVQAPSPPLACNCPTRAELALLLRQPPPTPAGSVAAIPIGSVAATPNPGGLAVRNSESCVTLDELREELRRTQLVIREILDKAPNSGREPAPPSVQSIASVVYEAAQKAGSGSPQRIRLDNGAECYPWATYGQVQLLIKLTRGFATRLGEVDLRIDQNAKENAQSLIQVKVLKNAFETEFGKTWNAIVGLDNRIVGLDNRITILHNPQNGGMGGPPGGGLMPGGQPFMPGGQPFIPNIPPLRLGPGPAGIPDHSRGAGGGPTRSKPGR